MGDPGCCRIYVECRMQNFQKKIIKIKRLINEGDDTDDWEKDDQSDQSLIQSLLDDTSDMSLDSMQLGLKSRRVAINIADKTP